MTQTPPKILTIADNGDYLVSLKAALVHTMPGVVVLTASSGAQGLALALAEDPDVILLDIVMPGMDGYEVCRQLKADDCLQHIPVVFLTAPHADRESRVRALDAGGEAFLAMPLDEVELTAQIRAMAKIKAANDRAREERERLATVVAERTAVLEQELALRVQTAEVLRQRSEELATVLDALPVAVWVGLDPECRVITGNRAANEFTGTPPDTNVSQSAVEEGQAVHLRILDEDGHEYQPHEQPMQRAIASGQTVRDVVLDFRFPDGRQAQVLGLAAPLFNAEGRPRGAVSAFLDITERLHAEAQLKEQLDELRRWHVATLGRETRILDLKRDVNELMARLGEPPRYGSVGNDS